MDSSTTSVINSVISIMRSMYMNQINELNRKLENLDLINLENLKINIEKEIKPEDILQNYDKVISTIEEIIKD